MDFRAGIGHAFFPGVVMRPLHRVLWVLAAFVALQGVQACASETPDPGLNPQPLPPQDEPVRSPETIEEGKSTGGGSTSSGGTTSGEPNAGVDGDAGDAGDGDSGGGD